MATYKKEMLSKMRMPSSKPKSREMLKVEISPEEASTEATAEDEEALEEANYEADKLAACSDEELMAEVERRGLMA